MRTILSLAGLLALVSTICAQDLVLDVSDPTKPTFTKPEGNIKRLLVRVGDASQVSAILIGNQQNSSELKFGGKEGIPITKENAFDVADQKVKWGKDKSAQTLILEPVDKLGATITTSDGKKYDATFSGLPQATLVAYGSASLPGNENDFIPDNAFLDSHLNSNPAFTGDALSQPERRILIDVANRSILYQKLKPNTKPASPTYETWTKHLCFHPLVGSDLQFRIINYDPEKDRVEIETDFTDLHLELQQRFGALWDPGSTAASVNKSGANALSTGDNKQKTDNAVVNNARSVAMYFARLRTDLRKLYLELQTRESSDLVVNRAGLRLVKQDVALRIMEKLGFDPDAKDGFAVRGKQLATDGDLDAPDQEAFMGIVASCKRYYDIIDRSSSFNKLPVHIENRDATNVSIKLYEGDATTPVDRNSFNLWNTGGIKIDFSAGFMWTRLIDGQFAKVYDRTAIMRDTTITSGDTTVTIDHVDKYKIEENTGSDFKVGAGLMAHAYWRTGGVFNPGLGVGFMVNSSSVVNYLLGASFALGRESRIVISTGVAFGEVKRLKTGTHAGDDVDPGAADIPTETVWKNDWFCGIGLNFIGNKPQSPAQGTN